MKFKPHDHRMWAVIGIYGGREQNTFYRRAEHGLEQHGTKELTTADTTPLGAAVIHAVTNPLDQITAAIPVYGGDFFATPRVSGTPNRSRSARTMWRTLSEPSRRLTNGFVKSLRDHNWVKLPPAEICRPVIFEAERTRWADKMKEAMC